MTARELSSIYHSLGVIEGVAYSLDKRKEKLICESVAEIYNILNTSDVPDICVGGKDGKGEGE